MYRMPSLLPWPITCRTGLLFKQGSSLVFSCHIKKIQTDARRNLEYLEIRIQHSEGHNKGHQETKLVGQQYDANSLE